MRIWKKCVHALFSRASTTANMSSGPGIRLTRVAARQNVPPVSVSGERLMSAPSDMDVSNFGVDENGRTVLMDFSEVGLLPETFVAHTLSSDKKFEPVVASLSLSGNSKLGSIAAIAQCLGMVSNPKPGTSTCARHGDL